MKNLPSLENDYVKLISPVLTPENIKLYSSWLEQPEIKEGIGQLEKLTKQDVFELLEGWKEDPLNLHWFISLRESGLLVGDLNLDVLKEMDEEYPELSDLEFYSVQNNAEIKIMISGDYQRRGIGKLATQSALNYGFKKRGLETIYASIYKDNIGSKKLFEKLGFKKIGSSKEKETGRDEVIMGLKRD